VVAARLRGSYFINRRRRAKSFDATEMRLFYLCVTINLKSNNLRTKH
jgi:hypothetical protein